MSPLPRHDDALASVLLSRSPYTRYLVVCRKDVWFIKFDGEEYGPYKTKREAMLFAIDAAHIGLDRRRIPVETGVGNNDDAAS